MVRSCSTCWVSTFWARRGGKGSNRKQGHQANHGDFFHKASMHCGMQYQGIGVPRCYLNEEARRWAGRDDGCLCCYRQGNSSHKHQDLHMAAFRSTLHSASYFSRSLAVLAGVIRPGVSLCNSTIFCATSS